MLTLGSSHPRAWCSLARLICVLFLGSVTSLALAAPPTPTVIGPLFSDAVGSATRNYTFLATDLDLAGRPIPQGSTASSSSNGRT